MKTLETEVIESFEKKWLQVPSFVSKAPGRVNLIGEHTDYMGGYVLPVAINRSIVFAVRATTDSRIRGYSLNYKEEASCLAGDYIRSHPAAWFRYVMGILSELQKAGYNTSGFDFCINGDIPVGSGLSSSAALEMATLTAMEALYNFKLRDTEAALLCQRAENTFIGVKCGIMDPLVSRIGVENHAVLIDCTTLSSRFTKVDMPGYLWLVIDSGKRRGLVDSKYNERQLECEDALRTARSKFPERNLKNLRDITIEDLPVLKKEMNRTIYRRMKHVVTENDRVLEMIRALEHKDLNTIGKLLHDSHQSLRYDFEVSCKELDELVYITSSIDGVCGARLTGAGFGGCIILLARKSALTEVRRKIRKEYHPISTTAGKTRIFPIKTENGARIIFSG